MINERNKQLRYVSNDIGLVKLDRMYPKEITFLVIC